MFKYLLFLLAISSSIASAQEQREEWRTGIKDTSYNTQRDFRNNLKKYPFIKVVTEQQMPNVTEKRNITYSKLGKRDLLVDAFIPKGKNKTAAILIIHGGGWRSGDRSQHVPLAQHLAAKGIASFTVEYRLSTEAFYPAAVHDIKSAVRWLKASAKQFNVDTNKIAILGFSAGGQLAALVGVTENIKKLEGEIGNAKYSSKVNAVIDIDGTLSFVHPESWEAQNLNTNKGASAMWLGYAGNERLDLWKEASPFTYANENKIPFLFLNSAVDRMHAGRDDFKNIMDKKGIYTEIVSFKDSPHSFCLYQPWFDLTVNHIAAFLGKVFK